MPQPQLQMQQLMQQMQQQITQIQIPPGVPAAPMLGLVPSAPSQGTRRASLAMGAVQGTPAAWLRSRSNGEVKGLDAMQIWRESSFEAPSQLQQQIELQQMAVLPAFKEGSEGSGFSSSSEAGSGILLGVDDDFEAAMEGRPWKSS